VSLFGCKRAHIYSYIYTHTYIHAYFIWCRTTGGDKGCGGLLSQLKCAGLGTLCAYSDGACDAGERERESLLGTILHNGGSRWSGRWLG
jgi:hypothetical protein